MAQETQDLEQEIDPYDKFLEVEEYARQRALELRSTINAGVGTIEETREAHAWLGFLRGIERYDGTPSL